MMTAGQFFLYLLIIIILKESLASAANSPDSEQPPSTISSDCVSVSTSELLQIDDGSSKENMGATHGFLLQAQQPDSRFVRGKLDCLALNENFRISGVGQHVEYFTR